jgi:hypothetical protein
MLANPADVLLNFFISIFTAILCAAIPFLFGYGLKKRSVGDARARFTFFFVLVMGTFMGFVLGAYIGLFAAFVFMVELIFFNRKERSKLPNSKSLSPDH